MSILSDWLHFRSRWSPLACRNVVDLVTDYVEGTMSPVDRRRFEAHLAGCQLCVEYVDQLRETIRLVGRLTPEDLTPQMRADLTRLYSRWRDGG